MRSRIALFTAVVVALVAARSTARAESFAIPRLTGITIDGRDDDWGQRAMHR